MPSKITQSPGNSKRCRQRKATNPSQRSTGKFVAQVPVDSSGQAGGAFGLALASSDDHVRFAAVEDINNTLEVWTIRTEDSSEGDAARARFESPRGAQGPVGSQGSPLTGLPGGVLTSDEVHLLVRSQAPETGAVHTAHQAAVDQLFSEL